MVEVKCSDSHLLGLVEEHLLQPQNVIHWRLQMGSFFLMREKMNLLFFFLMFFGASVFRFLISSGAFSITGGFKCIT